MYAKQDPFWEALRQPEINPGAVITWEPTGTEKPEPTDNHEPYSSGNAKLRINHYSDLLGVIG